MQGLWAKTIEDRAKVDLKFHFMPATLNEVVRGSKAVYPFIGHCLV